MALYELLTDAYTLDLVVTESQIQQTIEVRKEVLMRKYNLSEKKHFHNEDDTHSFIYNLIYKETGEAVGTVRICFINDRIPDKRLPMQKEIGVSGIEYLTEELPIGEISRLALKQNLPSHSEFSAMQLRSLLTLLLLVATRVNMTLYPYTRIFSIMETSLHTLLKRQRVFFEQIAPAVDYYGMRTPYSIERIKLLKDTEPTMQTLTNHYLKRCCTNPEPFLRFVRNNPYLDESDTLFRPLCERFEKYGEALPVEKTLYFS